MRGLMMGRPLQIPSLLDYAADHHGDTEMVSCTADQPVHRATYGELRDRTKQLANALLAKLGITDLVQSISGRGYYSAWPVSRS